MSVKRMTMATLCVGALIGVGWIFLSESTLEREAAQLGVLMEATEFCGLTPSPGWDDGVSGMYDFDRSSHEEFSRLRKRAQQTGRDEIARLKHASKDAQNQYCDRMRQIAKDLHVKLQ